MTILEKVYKWWEVLKGQDSSDEDKNNSPGKEYSTNQNLSLLVKNVKKIKSILTYIHSGEKSKDEGESSKKKLKESSKNEENNEQFTDQQNPGMLTCIFCFLTGLPIFLERGYIGLFYTGTRSFIVAITYSLA